MWSGLFLFLAGCGVDFNNNDGDTAVDTEETGTTVETDDTSPVSSFYDLDADDITDADDGVVPFGDFVYVDQGMVPSLADTYLVGWGIGGTIGESDWCSENLFMERFDDQSDWPATLTVGKVRFFVPDAVAIFFGNPRTFESGECDTSTDGGYDAWAMLSPWNGVDRAVCPNPLDENRLGLYLFKDEDGVFAPGCQGFALDPDANRDSDNDGIPDVDEDDTGGTDSGGGGNTDDADGDGYTVAEGDCDDADFDVNPGADEIDDNNVDDDCDGKMDESDSSADADGDGYTVDEDDCNDGDASIHPGASDATDDNVDNDCDGSVDEDYSSGSSSCASGTSIYTAYYDLYSTSGSGSIYVELLSAYVADGGSKSVVGYGKAEWSTVGGSLSVSGDSGWTASWVDSDTVALTYGSCYSDSGALMGNGYSGGKNSCECSTTSCDDSVATLNGDFDFKRDESSTTETIYEKSDGSNAGSDPDGCEIEGY